MQIVMPLSGLCGIENVSKMYGDGLQIASRSGLFYGITEVSQRAIIEWDTFLVYRSIYIPMLTRHSHSLLR